MDLHEENIYKIKAENMYLTAENHALKEENHALKEVNNDIVQRLKAAEDSVSLLKAEIIALKEVKNFEIRGFRKKMEDKISKIRKSRNSTYNNESATETQTNQHEPFSPSLTHLKPQFNWQTSPSSKHQFENTSADFGTDDSEGRKTSKTAKMTTNEEMKEFFLDLIKDKSERNITPGSKYSKISVSNDKGLCSYIILYD